MNTLWLNKSLKLLKPKVALSRFNYTNHKYKHRRSCAVCGHQMEKLQGFEIGFHVEVVQMERGVDQDLFYNFYKKAPEGNFRYNDDSDA